ncbi:DUF1007 family protein [Pseudogemmobacter sonorensis]|uniref:DUF1007 family protein n=1 Tax=Pseudogemmobacter sonorensis TaxID=2989681 RepID=UPI0036CC3161
MLSALPGIAGLFLAVSPAPARAHPHEFVDTAITFRFDDTGRLGAIGVVWIWDDLTSMLIVEDLGMDADGDGELTEAERQALSDRFGNWPEGFTGDLHLSHAGRTVGIGGPLDLVADYRRGRLIVSYLRALPERIEMTAGPVSLQVYDPEYYVFYDLYGVPEVVGRADCHVDVVKADIPAAQRIYDQLLGQLSEEEMMEEGRYPEVGGAFADEMRLECAAAP